MSTYFASKKVFVLVLGIMQDAGLPHAGCACTRCLEAFTQPEKVQYATALAIVDTRPEKPAVWLIDATPDIKFQLHALSDYLGSHPTRPDRVRPPDGIFLTHGHQGHTAGLAQLGPEAMAVEHLPVYGPAGLLAILRDTALLQPALQGFHLHPLTPQMQHVLAPDLAIAPISVPHRDEWNAGTFAYQIIGPYRQVLYLPDIDQWSLWPEAQKVLSTVDVAFVDAAFWSMAELKGRRPVAHPLVSETLELVGNLHTQIFLTHLNHTNPLLDPAGEERQLVEKTTTVRVAYFGQQVSL